MISGDISAKERLFFLINKANFTGKKSPQVKLDPVLLETDKLNNSNVPSKYVSMSQESSPLGGSFENKSESLVTELKDNDTNCDEKLFPSGIESPKLKVLHKFTRATPPAKRSARLQALNTQNKNKLPNNKDFCPVSAKLNDSQINNSSIHFHVPYSRTKLETVESPSLVTLDSEKLYKVAENLSKFQSVREAFLKSASISDRSVPVQNRIQFNEIRKNQVYLTEPRLEENETKFKEEEKINFKEALLKFRQRESQKNSERPILKRNFNQISSDKNGHCKAKRFCGTQATSQNLFAELKERIRMRNLARGIDSNEFE